MVVPFKHCLCERPSLSHCVALALFSDRADLLLRCLLFLKVCYGDTSSVGKNATSLLYLMTEGGLAILFSWFLGGVYGCHSPCEPLPFCSLFWNHRLRYFLIILSSQLLWLFRVLSVPEDYILWLKSITEKKIPCEIARDQHIARNGTVSVTRDVGKEKRLEFWSCARREVPWELLRWAALPSILLGVFTVWLKGWISY